MRSSVVPDEGNKVRLSVEIDEAEVDKALDGVVRRLSREVRVPGFRPGKVPRKVIEARMGGAAALRGEALREVLPDFYAKAVVETEVDPIAAPHIDITSGDESGDVSFDAVVEVRPTVAIPGYQGLEVTVPSLEVPDEDVTAQIDRLRATTGELVTVERPARDGDQVTIDITGRREGSSEPSDDLSAEDYLYEVGSGGVVPELDDQLRGARVGDVLGFDAEVASLEATVTFRVLVKDVKEMVLPEVTDEWAAEASEFSTVDELTADLRDRLATARLERARQALRDRTLDALVELVTEEIPPVLVDEELRERISDLSHRLAHQGMGLEQFLTATGQDERQFVDGMRETAERSVRADLALRALADQESIDVSDEDLEAELASMAERLDMTDAEVRRELDRGGRLPAVRSDLRKTKALQWLVDQVEVVDEDGDPVPRTLLVDHDEAEEDPE